MDKKRLFTHKLRTFFCLAPLLWSIPLARALDPSTPLADLRRQAWVLEDGLPQNTVQALAQSVQGYIWVGTEAGLARFDGREFRSFEQDSATPMASGNVNCLLAARDGALWLGTDHGLVRWANGSISTFSKGDGLPGDQIRTLAEAGDGTVWVWTDGGLARFNAGRLDLATGSSLSAGEAIAILTDRNGVLRVLRSHETETYNQGNWTSAPEQHPWLGNEISIAQELPDGTLAVASIRDVALVRGVRVLQHLTVGKDLPGARIQSLLADSRGALWIGTNQGLVRLVDGKLQSFPARDQLGAASVLSLLEDREGNLWVGTESNGLQILRDRRFFTMDTQQGLASNATTAVVEDANKTLWVGTAGQGLQAIPLQNKESSSEWLPSLKGTPTYTAHSGLASDVILSLAASPSGELWVGTPDGLNRIRGTRIDTYTLADGLPDDLIRSLLIDRDGSLWIGTRHGLAHRVEEPSGQTRLKIYTQASGLGSDLVGAMARDERGNLWVATLGGLSRVSNGKIINFTTANGLPNEIATEILPRNDGTVLIATEKRGLVQWDGEKLSVIAPSARNQSTIHAILDDGLGRLWFATESGIARCDRDQSVIATLNPCSHWFDFGAADGVLIQQMATNSHPSAWRSHDGRLWFATTKGIVALDPARFSMNTLPPPVVLERFAVDNADQPLQSASAKLSVPPGHVDFEFDYGGLSFVAPQEVRYRYMLQGFDREWTEAGTRRAAYYTNLPPGHYSFRVEAANNDGLWNETGAQLGFDLRRHFYQTVWFYALLLVATAVGIFLLLRLRLRMARSEFRAVLAERGRIAREIHDTLAQGYVGVSVQLELVAELLRRKKLDAAGQQLDATREYVREGLADARQSIWALRTQDPGDETLPVKLRVIVERAADAKLNSRFTVFGAFRPLQATTERELLRIAQEAIHNVKKHAAAHDLSVRLEYGQESIVLEVRDDGRGGALPSQTGFAAGHFGITGMQERAQAMGGSLEIQSAPGAGTTVCFRVPIEAHAEKRGQTVL